MRRTLALGIVLAASLVACDGDDGGGGSASGDTPTTGSTATTAAPSTTSGDLSAVAVTLTPVAEIQAPTGMAVREGDSALYVTDQSGTVRAVRDGALDPAPVLDVTDRTLDAGEQGLLGLAFSPDGSKLYVHYSDRTNNGDNQIDEFTMSGNVADPASRRPILSVETLQPNHNGGQLAFGPDGYLYIGLGDGGAAADQGMGHAQGGNGQSLATLLGKILRIDPNPSGGQPYTVPDDNPFVRDASARPEIWAFGLRNPWRFSFDRETDDLWIGDVGQNAWEEIDFAPAGEGAGANYGWNLFEGSTPFRQGEAPPDLVPPIFEYPNPAQGCTVIGGFVYRGEEIPDLRGAYVFGDYCAGEVRAFVQQDGQATSERSLGVSVTNLVAFGEDGSGELYVLSQGQGLLRVDPA